MSTLEQHCVRNKVTLRLFTGKGENRTKTDWATREDLKTRQLGGDYFDNGRDPAIMPSYRPCAGAVVLSYR